MSFENTSRHFIGGFHFDFDFGALQRPLFGRECRPTGTRNGSRTTSRRTSQSSFGDATLGSGIRLSEFPTDRKFCRRRSFGTRFTDTGNLRRITADVCNSTIPRLDSRDGRSSGMRQSHIIPSDKLVCFVGLICCFGFDGGGTGAFVNWSDWRGGEVSVLSWRRSRWQRCSSLRVRTVGQRSVDKSSHIGFLAEISPCKVRKGGKLQILRRET